jgi:hypothetical protein
VLKNEENAATEEERVRRFMEIKAQAVAFRKKVAAALDELKLPYQQDYTSGAVITDLLVEHDGKRIALECRANVQRDLEKSLVSARIIRDERKCDQVFIVVPKHDGDLQDACASGKKLRGIELKLLTRELRNLLSLS